MHNVVRFGVSGALAAVALFAPAEKASAQESVVSGCAGISLPRSVVTDILGPVITGVVTPTENALNPLLGVVNVLTGGLLPPLSINASGLLASAASGAPITLSVLDTSGVIVGPGTDCVATSDVITLDTEKGVSIGGNRITGLGTNGLEADAGELNSVALGNNAATDAAAIESIAIGNGATVGAAGIGSLALGAGANATAANSVALGADSTTTANLGAAAYNPGTGVIAGAVAAGEVSIGSGAQQRRLTNLAAGSAATDAVNVSQLQAVDARISAVDGLAIQYDNLTQNRATLAGVGGTVIGNLANGVVSSTSTEAVNGSQLHTVSQSVANQLGGGATVNVDGSIAGPTYQVQGNGYTTIFSAFGAVDTSITNITNNIGALGDRAVQYDGATGSAKDTITLQGGAGTLITNLRPGLLSTTSTDAVNGSQLNTTNVLLAQLEQTAVQYNVDGSGNRTNAVTLIGGDPNAPVIMHNVATGVDGNDAVNVAQLETGLSTTLNSANTYARSLAFDAGDSYRSYANEVGAQVLQSANNYTDLRVGQLRSEVEGVRSEARQAAAIGIAAGSLKFDSTPGKVSVGMSGGVWRGEGAAAFGAGYTSETGRLRTNVSATTAGGHWGAGAGLSLTLN